MRGILTCSASSSSNHHINFRHKALTLAIGSAIAIGFSGIAWGQATQGTIHGTVPVAPGEVVQVTGGAGFNRTVEVSSSGKYSITLPVGTYTVTLLQNGKPIQSRNGVAPVAGGGVTVDFTSAAGAANAVKLSTITVSAATLPAIDVTTTNQVTTITADQIHRLPIGRSSSSIALLSPGVQPGVPDVGGLVFGGASAAENARYIDGMNTTDQYDNEGGWALPFGSVAQQQTYISGYGAKYGRSIGGVISQVGKSGSNKWHFGFRAFTNPARWTASPLNAYFNNPLSHIDGEEKGDIENYNKEDLATSVTYDAYVSGPIIKDKLFFYVAGEKSQTLGSSIGSIFSPYKNNYRNEDPKQYLKLNWNITDNNVLSLTMVNDYSKSWSNNYDYDYDTHEVGDFFSASRTYKTHHWMWVANYTSYITNSLTLHAMFGKMHSHYYSFQPPFPGFDPSLPHIEGINNQNPKFIPNGPVQNTQTSSTQPNTKNAVNITSYRLSLDYQLDNHDFQVGIDNITSWDLDDGFIMTGPGYAWDYDVVGDINKPLFGSSPDVPPYVAPVGSNPAGAGGYFVKKLIDEESANVRVAQRAQYIQDRWQVTPKFLLTLGLRNDQYVNYNSDGVPYIRETKPQWQPRIGFSWDVFGDSSLKVFGNAGRYYLALPLAPALKVSGPVKTIQIYGTYTGIDQQTGAPIGFQPLPQIPSTGVSIDHQYGQAKDPKTAAAQGIGAEYSDNFVLGLQKAFHMFGEQWVAGITGTYQKMDRIIDDFDYEQGECTAGRAQGLTWMTSKTCSQWTQSLLFINPGVDNKIFVKGPDGELHSMMLTKEAQGFPRGPIRKYGSIDIGLEHRWDGKWSARFDYVWSHSWGNTEGPISSYSSQNGSYESLTTAWDFPERMDFSYGTLPNNRTNQFKFYGAYALTPEVTLGVTARINSGTPVMCRGPYGPEELYLHGSSTYYWCGGKPVPPGSLGDKPWYHNYDFSVNYEPSWANHKLRFRAVIFNVFNTHTPLLYDHSFGTTVYPNAFYNMIESRQGTRQVRLSVAYNY